MDGSLQPACIIVRDGSIAGLEEKPVKDATDFGDAIIMPGAIDAHVHLNEPGRTEWEGFDTGTKAAAAGGVTTVIDMPLNSNPVTTTLQAFQEKLDASKGKMHVNVGFYGGLVPGNIDQIDALARAGVLGIKCFLTHSGIDDFPNVSLELLTEALPVISGHHLPLLVHCELTGSSSPASKFKTYIEYLDSRPDEWETTAVKEVVKAADETGGKVHIVHVSSKNSLPFIIAAKEAGISITAETCPHYIFFNAEDIPDNKTVYKCAPPIRSKANNLQLIAALKNGTLDFIASDHSPAPPELKKIDSGDLAQAWGGIAGLQFLLTSSYTALKGHLSLEEFIPLLTEQPARFLQINNRKGFLKPGFDADITIWDPAFSHTVHQSEILHKHSCSPYIGTQLYGRVLETIVNGQTVFSNNHIKNLNAGRWLLKK